MASSALQQLPSRLAPLPEVLARIDALARPIEPRAIEVAAAAGRILAADVMVEGPLPPAEISLRDGWAVRADAVADAGPYTPVPLIPRPTFVEVGAALPADADAVLPADAATIRSGVAEATAAAVPGDGVLQAGAEVAAGQILRRAGERLRSVDVAVLSAAGVPRVRVRVPRVVFITANAFIDPADDTVTPTLAGDVDARGISETVRGAFDGTPALEDALRQTPHVDAIVIVGGSGAGRHDWSVRTLARLGTVHLHGVGLTPGETAALGSSAPSRY